jgi:hypothetical protein
MIKLIKIEPFSNKQKPDDYRSVPKIKVKKSLSGSLPE